MLNRSDLRAYHSWHRPTDRDYKMIWAERNGFPKATSHLTLLSFKPFHTRHRPFYGACNFSRFSYSSLKLHAAHELYQPTVRRHFTSGLTTWITKISPSLALSGMLREAVQQVSVEAKWKRRNVTRLLLHQTFSKAKVARMQQKISSKLMILNW